MGWNHNNTHKANEHTELTSKQVLSIDSTTDCQSRGL